MAFDFDLLIDRKGTNSVKWDLDKNTLAMWVADMDFELAPCIKEALQKRLSHGIFGYNIIPQSFYESIVSWWGDFHGLKIDKESILFSNGVVPALAAMIRLFSKKGDKILVQSPVYHMFFHIIKDNDRVVVENKLAYNDGVYTVDFKDLEQKLATQSPALMILCNPNNPTGKLFDKGELTKISKLCKKHGAKIISDEIHCDIVESPFSYTSFYEIDSNAIITLSATKAFNLAGLCGSFNIIKSPSLRHRVQKEFRKSGITMPNTMILEATSAAFSPKGRAWLNAMNAYVAENKAYAYKFIEQNTPCRVVRSKALYMIWIECFCKDSGVLAKFLREKYGLFLSSGADFRGNGKGFLRLNLACPRSILKQGLEKFEQGIKAFNKLGF
ncbi:MalY/PatB family protein [Campylobacter troglodytis]|uniref:MalY/PatB family protein n=1 Tax=Campylobacter troglodytis TaxID=654363 RepID=UPI00115A1092|nr:MalY/PatB family protein [Campylobacter troglodytis]TQR61535.1 cystathionine beta-lyase [Campylobacter troglodytis]